MIIKTPQGADLLEIKEYEYNGSFMGDKQISASVKSPTPINFAIGSYVEYRGDTFKIYDAPNPKKIASTNSYGSAYQYDVILKHDVEDLKQCSFLDYVVADNVVHYSNFAKQSFFADVTQLGERIQTNLNRLYPGKWLITVQSSDLDPKNLSFSNNNCLEALNMAHSVFGLNYVINGHSIIIGTQGITVPHIFEYGKGNGLREIAEATDKNQKIVTRLRPYGNKRNLPSDYNKGVGILPDTFYAPGLMLPNFSITGIDYIDSAKKTIYGVREGIMIFDGNNNTKDIYPSISGMTAQNLIDAGVPTSSTGNLDEVLSVVPVTEQNKTNSTVVINIKDIGFDINDYLSVEDAKISFRNGACAGYEMTIVSCVQEGSGYKLVLNKVQDGDIHIPNVSQNIAIGDKFVLLGIEMPDVYVRAAEVRLQEEANKWLLENDHERKTYSPVVDNIFLAQNPDIILRDGDLIQFEDVDLGIDTIIIIQTLNIKHGGVIPTYEVTLSDKKPTGFWEKVEQAGRSINSFRETIERTFSDGLISDAEFSVLEKSLNDLLKEKQTTKAVYDVIHANTYLADKTQIETDYASYITAYNNISNKLTEVISDRIITSIEKENISVLFQAYATAISQYKESETEALKSITDSMQSTLVQWASDGIINPTEKLAIKQTRQRIAIEKESVLESANKYSIPTIDYVNKWNAYDSVLAKYSADTPENIPLGTDFATAEEAYKTSKIAIDALIINAQKTDINSKLSSSNFSDLFEFDTQRNAIKAKFSLYSTGEVSAYGIGTGSGSGASYERLDIWSAYTSDKSGWVLSALLGKELHDRVSDIEQNGSGVTSWNDLTDKPSAFPPTAHTHVKSQITDFPTSLPASDVYAWAKALTKPSYTASEIGGLGASYRWLTDAYISTWNAKEPAIVKLTAFNKNFGTTAGTVAEGNHTHTFANITGLQGALDGKMNNLTGLTNNYVSKWNGSTYVNSSITDNGTSVGISTNLRITKSFTSYQELVVLENTINPGDGAVRFTVKHPNAAFLLQAYGSSSPGYLANAASIVATVGSSLLLGASANIPVHLYSNNSYSAPNITIGVNGNVGIGNTNPTSKLEVNGTGKFKDDILMTFNTWSHSTNKNSLNKFLKLFDIDTAGNLVVKTNLYSTGEVTAYSSGTGVSGLTLMADMDANGKNITDVGSISSQFVLTLKAGDATWLALSDDGIHTMLGEVEGLTSLSSADLNASRKVTASEFKFGSWSFKEVSGNMVIYYNGTAKATIQSSRTNSNL